MKSRLHTFSAVALILVFGLSNIGLPIVMSLCPMMQQNPSECRTMCENPAESLAFVNQNADCCDSYIVAERNTTPFLKTEKGISYFSSALLPLTIDSPDNSLAITSPVQSNLSPQDSPPLFLLHSALLI